MENLLYRIVTVGHVDHGKSTILGRLLADTGSLPDGKLAQVKETCRRHAKPFEYAFLLDALKDEQAQGITIDAARIFFKTPRRNYLFMDAPGHKEFLKNMVTGAAGADAALLVIDAVEGVRENSKRHGYMLSMLGIKTILVCINKIDLVDYRADVFENLSEQYAHFLKELSIQPIGFIPVSGLQGDNIASCSTRMPWYTGKCLLEHLDELPHSPHYRDKDFRLPVQGVYKFTQDGDTRRIVAGTILSGSVRPGDDIVFYPSGKRSEVMSIERFNAPSPDRDQAGSATGLTLKEQIYIRRGDLAVLAKNPPPKTSSLFRGNIFWLGQDPLDKNQEYTLKLNTMRCKARCREIKRAIESDSLTVIENPSSVTRFQIAECTFSLDKAIAYDRVDLNPLTSRFVLVHDYQIKGGGIITEDLRDDQKWLRDKIIQRNIKWEMSEITENERAERLNQKSALIVITGRQDSGKKPLAKTLERELFIQGKMVYFLGIRNVLYGVDADIISRKEEQHQEHIRRLAETAYLMLDMGVIVFMTATRLRQTDLEIIKSVVPSEKVYVIWVGPDITTDIPYDLHLPQVGDIRESSEEIKQILRDKGILFRAW
ncbi:MAG: adenylyl-sulfate kinase [Candidatus Delongbacteria bacterium]|nr:adenylyl-sulfate kinase [Candidatus Delongbacteria bacterium]